MYANMCMWENGGVNVCAYVCMCAYKKCIVYVYVEVYVNICTHVCMCLLFVYLP